MTTPTEPSISAARAVRAPPREQIGIIHGHILALPFVIALTKQAAAM